VTLKEARLAQLLPRNGFHFVKASLEDARRSTGCLPNIHRSGVINLAAQAGVRFSLTNPHEYLDSNIIGFLHILEGCRHNNVEHLVYASSSSVYGANTKLPFSVHQNVDHPLSLYAATKKANELMAHTYAHLYRLPVTGLRFSRLRSMGPAHMSMFMFTDKIIKGEADRRLQTRPGTRAISPLSTTSCRALVRATQGGHAQPRGRRPRRFPPRRRRLPALQHRQSLPLMILSVNMNIDMSGRPHWTVDGEKPQSRHRQPIEMCVGVRHQLVGLLGRRIKAQRMSTFWCTLNGSLVLAP